MPSLASSPTVRHGKTRLFVVINGKEYVLTHGKADAARHKLWRLKSATAAYSVVFGPSGVACSCPDSWRFGIQCKHIGALKAHGLVPRSALVADPGIIARPATAAPALKGGA